MPYIKVTPLHFFFKKNTALNLAPSCPCTKRSTSSSMETYDVGRAIVESMRPRRLVHLSRGGTALCTLCRGINVQNISAPGGYQHASNPRDMVESAETCPLCERFILRPEGVIHWMEHQAATGPISCSLVGPLGFKRLVLNTENWITRPGDMRTGKLVEIPVFTDAGKHPTIRYVPQVLGE
jgi:hypothetical protein